MAKAKAKPEWQRLIERSQRLWAAYDSKPTKANLEKFGAHLEKMKVSKSMKVKAERTRGARAFRQQWKAAGYHMAAKKPAKRKATKKKAAKRRAPRKNPGYTVMLEHVDGRHKIGHGETVEQAEGIASKQLGRPVKVDFHSTELVSGDGGQLYFIEGPELTALQDSILYIEAGSGNWDPEDEMNIRYAPRDSRGEIDREEWLDAVRGLYYKGFALTRTGSLEEEKAWHADKDSSWWRFHGLTDAEIRYVTGWSDIVPNPKPKRKAAKKKAGRRKATKKKVSKKKASRRKNPAGSSAGEARRILEGIGIGVVNVKDHPSMANELGVKQLLEIYIDVGPSRESVPLAVWESADGCFYSTYFGGVGRLKTWDQGIEHFSGLIRSQHGPGMARDLKGALFSRMGYSGRGKFQGEMAWANPKRKNPGDRDPDTDYEAEAYLDILVTLQDSNFPHEKSTVQDLWMMTTGAQKKDFNAAWKGALRDAEIEHVSGDEYRLTPRGSTELVKLHGDDPRFNPRKRSPRKSSKKKAVAARRRPDQIRRSTVRATAANPRTRGTPSKIDLGVMPVGDGGYKWAQNYAVRGSGIFPSDMLRYDSSFADASEPIGGRDLRTVRLTRYVKIKRDQPTAGRWLSFGWEVLGVEDVKLSPPIKEVQRIKIRGAGPLTASDIAPLNAWPSTGEDVSKLTTGSGFDDEDLRTIELVIPITHGNYAHQSDMPGGWELLESGPAWPNPKASKRKPAKKKAAKRKTKARKNPMDRLTAKHRNEVNGDLIAGGFDGNGRFKSMGAATNKAWGILARHGIEQGQVVSADLFRGDSGHITLRMAFSNESDAFSPQEIQNSMLAWQWHWHTPEKLEVVAYAS